MQKWTLQIVKKEMEKWGHLSSFHVSFMIYDP